MALALTITFLCNANSFTGRSYHDGLGVWVLFAVGMRGGPFSE